MFIKKPRVAIFWPVSWMIACAVDAPIGASCAAAAVEEVSIRLKFRRCGNAAFNERWSADTSGFTAEQVRAHNRKLFDDFVEGWADYVDEAGLPVPFTAAEIDELLDQPNFPQALGLAFTRFHLAQPEERAKNSGPSPAGGPATAPAETTEMSATS